jgi:hypothetical protein
MRTFTVQIKDSDAELVLAILKKFNAKVVEQPKESQLTLEIAETLREVKLIQEGKLQPQTLNNI